METFKAKNNKQQRCAFKSYYVVWKQDPFKPDDKKKAGLNRTMQYGNGFLRCI